MKNRVFVQCDIWNSVNIEFSWKLTAMNDLKLELLGNYLLLLALNNLLWHPTRKPFNTISYYTLFTTDNAFEF